MENRNFELTPENYTRAIISLSRRYFSTSVFPGNNFIDLAEWMAQERYFPKSGKLKENPEAFASRLEQPHALAVAYTSGEKGWDIKQYNQEQHEDFRAATSVPVGGLGQIVFLRGFLSPSWVAAIGSKYNIDPELFRRHMDFLSPSIDRHSYGYPSLPSCSENMLRLCVNTILHRDDFGGQDLQSQRLRHCDELSNYRTRHLRSTRVRCGDSVVREYSTVCSSFSVIEQWISLYITRTGKGWTVLAWMDHGGSLEQSPSGPWTSDIDRNATALPVLQHHPKMAFRTTANHVDSAANTTAEVPQSTTMLPLQYDSLIALVDLTQSAPRDPLFMCIPLFAHAAFSEVQFLNLMESRISLQITTISQEISGDALETLQYFSNILKRHAQQLKDSIQAIIRLMERRNHVLGDVKIENHNPKVASSLELEGGPFRPKSLLEDHEQLHVRCIELSKMCTWGITLAMNKATIEESRKAIEQSERLKKLTLLATLFIPLTFSSSLLGMNIDLLGQNSVKYWWFFVLCVPTTLAACVFYLWDTQVLRQCFVRLWKRCCAVKVNRRFGMSEKDPSHLV